MITGRSISDTDAVDPHLLRTFACVARLGSFSAAAGELGYTQSAVSQQVASLETDLGVALLTRRPVAPTPAGARLLEHAGPLLLRLEAARADIARLTAAPAASLTVGVTPLAVTARFAAALARTRRAHPALQVTIQVTGRERLITAVASGKLDVGLTDGLAAPNDQLHLPDVGPLIAVGAGQSRCRSPSRRIIRWLAVPVWTCWTSPMPAGSTRPTPGSRWSNCGSPAAPTGSGLGCAMPAPMWPASSRWPPPATAWLSSRTWC